MWKIRAGQEKEVEAWPADQTPGKGRVGVLWEIVSVQNADSKSQKGPEYAVQTNNVHIVEPCCSGKVVIITENTKRNTER